MSSVVNTHGLLPACLPACLPAQRDQRVASPHGCPACNLPSVLNAGSTSHAATLSDESSCSGSCSRSRTSGGLLVVLLLQPALLRESLTQ
jgi:hypothetical protein